MHSSNSANLDCSVSGSDYSCTLSNVDIRNESDDLNITSNHLPEYNDFNVTLLRIASTTMEVFQPTVMQKFPNICQLTIFETNLREISSSAFDSCDALATLIIEGNMITTLPPRLFQNCRSLRTLTLLRNFQLQDVTSESFLGLEGLTALTVRYSNLSAIPDNFFQHFRNVTNLQLNFNQIQFVDFNAFNHLSRIGTINLADNLLTFDTIFFNSSTTLPTLSVLSFRMNRLTSLKTEFFHKLTNVVTLSLEYNQIDGLPPTIFDFMTRVTTFNLYSNRIPELTAELFVNNVALNILNLRDNFISNVHPDSFKGLTRMTRIFLNDNPIKHLDVKTFSDSRGLQRILMGSCG